MAKVLEYLYISDISKSSNLCYLEENNITHIINCTPAPCHFPSKIEYLHLPMEDVADTNITQHFQSSFEFIKGSKEKNGRTLVHCEAGISRSATIVLSYLIQGEKMSLKEAHSHLLSARKLISPNKGFWNQLFLLEQQLRNESSLSFIDIHSLELSVIFPHLPISTIQDALRDRDYDDAVELLMTA